MSTPFGKKYVLLYDMTQPTSLSEFIDYVQKMDGDIQTVLAYSAWKTLPYRENLLNYVLDHNVTSFRIGMLMAHLISYGEMLDVTRANEYVWHNKMKAAMWDPERYAQIRSLWTSSSSRECHLVRPFKLWNIMSELIVPQVYTWKSIDIDDMLDFYEKLPNATKAEQNRRKKVGMKINEILIKLMDSSPDIVQDIQKQRWYPFITTPWLVYGYFTTTDNRYSLLGQGPTNQKRRESLKIWLDQRMPGFLSYLEALKILDPKVNIVYECKKYEALSSEDRARLADMDHQEIGLYLS